MAGTDLNVLEDRAYNYIRQMIVLGEARSGERLAERKLAAKVGVSRTPVRQAFHRLAREGLVSQLPNFGVVVNPVDPRDVEEIFELRAALEATAAARAARRITGSQLQYLRELCDEFFVLTRRIKQHGWQRWSELDADIQEALNRNDLAFHMHILRVADHRRVLQLFNDLQIYSFIFEKLPINESANVLNSMVLTWRTHRRLLRTLKSGDSEAARNQVYLNTVLATERILRLLVRTQAAQHQNKSDSANPSGIVASATSATNRSSVE